MVTDKALDLALSPNVVRLADGYDRRKHPAHALYRCMTPDEARSLEPGEEVPVDVGNGTAKRVRVSGKPKTWKRDASRVEVPAKYGMYQSIRFCAHDGRMIAFGVPSVRLLVYVSGSTECGS